MRKRTFSFCALLAQLRICSTFPKMAAIQNCRFLQWKAYLPLVNSRNLSRTAWKSLLYCPFENLKVSKISAASGPAMITVTILKMSHTRGRSFVEVICEKYSPENFPYRRGMGIGIHISGGPQGSPLKSRLNLPTILVLDSCGITTAGKESDIAAFCSHVSELDLSDNNLQDWYEISKIVSNLAKLTFLNLTSNPLTEASLDPTCAASFSQIQRLVLNNTKVSWETIHILLPELPGKMNELPVLQCCKEVHK